MSFQSTIHHDWRVTIDQIISSTGTEGKGLLLFLAVGSSPPCGLFSSCRVGGIQLQALSVARR